MDNADNRTHMMANDLPQQDEQMNESAVLASLSALGVAYTYHTHAPAYTMDDCAAFDRAHGIDTAKTSHCKNLFLCNRKKTAFYLLVVDGDKPFRTAEFSKLLGVSRLSFGPADALLELLGCHPGAVGPFGLLFDREKRVQLVCDAALKTKERLLFHPSVNTSTVVLDSRDFFDVFLPHTGHVPSFVELPG